MAEKIQIFSREYQVPAIPREFSSLQQEISEKAELVQLGEAPRRGLMGLIRREAKALDTDHRFELLDDIVGDYYVLIEHLRVHREEYLRFFDQLIAGVCEGAARKVEEARRLDRERQEIVQEAQRAGDPGLADAVAALDQRLLGGVRLLAHATLLILRKIDLCIESIGKLADDERTQREVLDRLLQSVCTHRRALQLERRLRQFERDVAEMAQQALSFESVLREYFGPLQTLLEQASEVDGHMASAVGEIELIAHDLEEGIASLQADDDPLVEFLVRSQLKGDRLRNTLDRMWREADQTEADVGLATTGTMHLKDALANIEALLDVRRQAVCAEVKSSLPRFEVYKPWPFDRDEARRRQERTAVELQLPARREIYLCDGLTLPLALVPAGTSLVGSADSEAGRRDDEGPQHLVRISRPFYICAAPLSHEQCVAALTSQSDRERYQKLVERILEESFDAVRTWPASCVSWNDARRLAEQLSARTRSPFGLPTEAQWEHAWRAGTSTRYAAATTGRGEGGNQAQPANPWGLRGSGEVLEWCADWYSPDYYRRSPEEDPAGPERGSARVLRCALIADARSKSPHRIAARHSAAPGEQRPDIGLRLIMAV